MTMLASVTAMTSLVAAAEWAIGTRGLPAGAIPGPVVRVALAVPIAVIALFAVATPSVLVLTNRTMLDPLVELAHRARRIAQGESVEIPYTRRTDQRGDLARALRDWQDSNQLDQVLLSNAPVGILFLDGQAIRDANPAALAMLRRGRAELQGRAILEFTHPDRQYLADSLAEQAMAGAERMVVESRLLRGDGTWLWSESVIAPVRVGETDSFVVILEDISERKRRAQQAADLQRQMLPAAIPRLDGYELACTFLPAQEVAGDLYDWEELGDGFLDLTLADVMGKGMSAALVMAALRAALRTAPEALGPADRVARAAGAVTFGGGGEEPFVTLFRARLEKATGRLTYVDAGHGYCVVLRAGGGVERLTARSLPLGLGIAGTGALVEGEVRLEPGDTLLVCSDGLLESGDRTERLDDVAVALDERADVGTFVESLMSRVGPQPADDVTVIALHRLDAKPPARSRRDAVQTGGLPRTPC
jgi:PAS domain S-box-containing protein